MDFLDFLATKTVKDARLAAVTARTALPKGPVLAPGTERQRDKLTIDWEAACRLQHISPYPDQGPAVGDVIVFLRLTCEHMITTRNSKVEGMEVEPPRLRSM